MLAASSMPAQRKFAAYSAGVQPPLANHVGNSVERLGEGMPKPWRGGLIPLPQHVESNVEKAGTDRSYLHPNLLIERHFATLILA
jgi:hypothetical protein